jgi:hypothetical protein
MYYTSSMVRTYQKRGGRVSTPQGPKKGVKNPPAFPKHKLGYEKQSLKTRVLRWVVILVLCCIVAAVAFVAGGYVGLVKAVENLDEVSAAPSRPTYIYSKPVGETEGSTRVIGTIFQGENRKKADLETWRRACSTLWSPRKTSGFGSTVVWISGASRWLCGEISRPVRPSRVEARSPNST